MRTSRDTPRYPKVRAKKTRKTAQAPTTPRYTRSVNQLRPAETAAPTKRYHAASDRMCPEKNARTPRQPCPRESSRYPRPIVAHQSDQYGFEAEVTIPSITGRAPPDPFPSFARPGTPPPPAPNRRVRASLGPP